MTTIVVRYRPKADRADENEKLVEAVFAELATADQGGVRYATYKLADGTFIHIADVETDPNPLGSIAAFAEFQKDIADRCEEGEGPNPSLWSSSAITGCWRPETTIEGVAVLAGRWHRRCWSNPYSSRSPSQRS